MPSRLAQLRKASKMEALARENRLAKMQNDALEEDKRQKALSEQAELTRKSMEIFEAAKRTMEREQELNRMREESEMARQREKERAQAQKKHSEALRRGFFSAERRSVHAKALEKKREEVRAAREAARAKHEKERESMESVRRKHKLQSCAHCLRGDSQVSEL